MQVALTKGLSELDKRDVESQFKTAKKLLLRIRKELESKITQSLQREEVVAFMSAGENRDKYVAELGFRRGIREVLTLLPEEKSKK